MRKTAALFLILCFILSVLSGCGGTDKPSDGSSLLPGDLPAIPGLNDSETETLNLYGSKIRYAIKETLGYGTDSLFADLARARIAEVEKKYNFIFDFLPDIDLNQAVSSALAVDDVAADILQVNSYDQASLIRDEEFYNMLQLSDILNVVGRPDKWGNSNQLASFVWNDSVFGVLPMYFPETVYSACDFVIFVNEKMVCRELGMSDPREFVENGTWDRDKFGELVDGYAHTDGTNEISGLCMYKVHFYDMAMRTAGVEYAVKDSGGNWSSGFTTDAAQECFQWARDFVTVQHVDSITLGDTYPMINRFVNGDSAMVLTHVGKVMYDDTTDYKSIAKNVEDFGILPFPLGKNMKYGEWIGQHEYMPYGISFQRNAEDPEALAAIVDALYEPFEDYATEEDRLNYYKQYLFHDDRDAEIIYKMLENCRYTYYIDGARTIVETMSNKTDKTIAELLESSQKSYVKVLEEVIIPSYQSIEHIWGEQ